MRKLRRFLALSLSTKRLFIRSLLVVTAMRLGLICLSYERLRRVIAGMAPALQPDLEEIRSVAWGVSAAAKYVPGATCLTQALAGQFLLARLGKKSQIRIGVQRGTGSELKAHAWLISGERVVLGGPPLTAASHAHLIDYGQ